MNNLYLWLKIAAGMVIYLIIVRYVFFRLIDKAERKEGIY